MIRAGFLLVLVALSGPGFATTENEMQEVLAQLRAEHGFPGATLAWSGAEGNVHTLAVGLADPDRGQAMTPDSRMLAASIGKTFVAAAVLTARDEDQLELDAPIGRWLADRDWFERLPNHESLTLRHLLTHTGGLQDHVYLPAFEAMFERARGGADTPGPEELIGLVLDSAPLFAPGEGWAYTDTGYLVAARVLEAATDQSWTRYVRRHFLKPLELKATTPSNRRRLPGLATGITDPDNPFGLPERLVDRKGRLVWDPALEDAGGGFVTTAGDLARWGRALWSGRLHSRAAFHALLDGVSIGPERPGVTYGLGVVIESTEAFGEVRAHRGWIPGYVSSLRYFPDHDTAIALQINSDAGMMGEDGAFMEIEGRLTEALLPKRPDAN